jgi:guanylate kinase
MRIILVGKAGSGKDYFRDWLASVEELDVSYTTRQPRKGEADGYTYNYVDEYQFLTMKANDAFLEAVDFNGWMYGTSQFNWDTKTVFIMTPSGTNCIPKEDRNKCVFIYFDIPIEVRRGRLAERSDADSVDRRILADEEDFKDFKDFDIRIKNPLFDAQKLYTTILTYYYV